MTSSPDAARDDLPPALSSMWRLCVLGYRHEPGLMLDRIRAVAALGAARRAARALAQAARPGPARTAAAPALRRGDRPRPLRDGHVVPPHRQHPRPAAVPRQGDDRPGSARRAPARLDRDDRAPRAPRPSRSALDAAQPDLRPRSHVHVRLRDRRLDPPARRDDRPARVDSSGARAAGGLRPPHGAHLDMAAHGRARRPGARRPVRPPRPSPLRDGDNGGAGERGARPGHRRAPRRPAPGGLGAVVRPDRGRALGLRRVALARLGDLRRRLRRRDRLRGDAPGSTPGNVLLVLAAGSRLSAYVGATVGEIGFLRGFWMDGSRRLAWLEDYAASFVAAADRRCPARCTRASACTTCRSPIRDLAPRARRRLADLASNWWFFFFLGADDVLLAHGRAWCADARAAEGPPRGRPCRVARRVFSAASASVGRGGPLVALVEGRVDEVAVEALARQLPAERGRAAGPAAVAPGHPGTRERLVVEVAQRPQPDAGSPRRGPRVAHGDQARPQLVRGARAHAEQRGTGRQAPHPDR